MSVGYGVAFSMVAVIVYDLAMRLAPYRFDASWRIGAFGTVSLQLPQLLLAVLIVAVVALMLDHVWVLRAMAIVTALSAVLMLGLLGVFVMDVLELRALVPAEGRRLMELTMGRAALGVILAVAVTAWLSVGSWRVARRINRRIESKHSKAGTSELEGSQLLVSK